MSKNFQKFYFLILVLFLFFCWATEAKANGSLEITFEKDPLFDKTDFLPGDSTTNWIKVKNNSAETKSIFVWADNVIDPDNLGNVLNLEIKEGANTLYNDTLSNLFASSSVYLSDLFKTNQTQYDLTLKFNILAGNEYQGKTLKFDFSIGISPLEREEEEEQVPSLAVVVGGGGGGGAPITLQIYNVRTINITHDKATITWQTTLFSTSQLIFAAENEAHNFDPSNPPKYGYSHIYPEPEDSTMVSFHTVLLPNLKPCTTYYFRVISHQASGSSLTISPEYSFTTLCLLIEELEREEREEEKPKKEIIREIEAPSEEIEEKPAEEEIVEEKPVEEEIVEEKPVSRLAGMLAAIGNTLSNFGKILVSCLPWWLILILVLYSLGKGISTWQKFKKEQDESKKLLQAESNSLV